jgi:hypothetical protein
MRESVRFALFAFLACAVAYINLFHAECPPARIAPVHFADDFER